MLLDVVFPCRLDRLKNNFVWLVDSWKINQFNLLRLSVALGETGTQASVDCIGTCRALVQLLLQHQKHQHAGDVSLGQQDGESNAKDRTNAAM